ncbi:MAG: biotin--[acetyl-CoA-carboxylase] ligase [Clostridia bacterium]|nr:biotin--[acetyl-CoA-carboxylase] ligase [Clostridia bacterium]
MLQDALSSPLLQELCKRTDGFVFDVRASLPSTNVLLKEMARESPALPEGYVLLAESQSQGHGRFERVFSSPKGGVYMSVLLRPSLPAAKAVLLTAAAAVAVAEAAEELTKEPFSIKWVNDVYQNGRKIAGILTEGALTPDGALAYAVLGIGINVLPPKQAHPQELSSIVGTVFKEKAPLPDNPRAQMAALVLERFWHYYTALDQKSFLEGYRSRSLLTGKIVKATIGDMQKEVTVLGIDEDCRLLVKDKDGVNISLQSGEVSLSF